MGELTKQARPNRKRKDRDFGRSSTVPGPFLGSRVMWRPKDTNQKAKPAGGAMNPHCSAEHCLEVYRRMHPERECWVEEAWRSSVRKS